MSTQTILKRAGIAGFLFFFIKGLAWLALLAAAGVGANAW